MNKLPWEFDSELTTERVNALAKIIIDARHDCLELHNEGQGDSNWSYGCRAREWVRKAIKKAEKDKDLFPFLSILEDSGQKFTFALANTPIQFFKSDGKNLNSKIYKKSTAEAQQLSLFDSNRSDQPRDMLWRFLVDTSSLDLTVTRVELVDIGQSKEIICHYEVPIADSITKVYDVSSSLEEGIELPEAPVSNQNSIRIKKLENRETQNGS